MCVCVCVCVMIEIFRNNNSVNECTDKNAQIGKIEIFGHCERLLKLRVHCYADRIILVVCAHTHTHTHVQHSADMNSFLHRRVPPKYQT